MKKRHRVASALVGNLLASAALALTVSVACSRSLADANGPNIPARKDYAGIVQALQPFVEREIAEKELPGLSIAIIDDQQIVWAQGFGMADPQKAKPATARTVYRIGSVSKLFTDIGIMQLVERGELNLDAPITDYLPDFRPRNPFATPITLRQLMSHRSGLLREPPVGNYFETSQPSLAATVRSLNETELVFEPNTHTKYSNAAIAVVGYLLEARSHQPFAKYLKGSVLDRMGLTHSSFEPDPNVIGDLAKAEMWTYDGLKFAAPTFQLGMAPAGSMYSTVTDLGHFLSVLMAHGQTNDGALLKPETIEQMWSPQFSNPGGRVFGLGFMVRSLDGHRLVGHGGAIYGFATTLDLLPEDKVGVVVITTKDAINAVTERIGEETLKLVLDQRAGKPLTLPPATSAVPAEIGRALAGRYRSGDDAVDISYLDGRLNILNFLYVFEKDYQLNVLIEWFEFDRLTQVSDEIFKFPSRGLYDGENAVFTRDASGNATQVQVSGVVFKRRPIGGVASGTFHIPAVKDFAGLRKQALADHPPAEAGEFRKADLVELSTLDPTIKLDIRYATTNNFLAAPVYSQPRAFLQRPAAEALLRVHKNLKELGYGLLIHDAYRPWYVTKIFREATPEDKRIFVADPSQGSRHNRGCAVDLSLYELATGKPVEMVGVYDEMSERSYAGYPGGTSLQRWHRELLRRAMEDQGFLVYPFEWWHFDYRDWKKYPILNLTFEQLSLKEILN